LAERRGRVLALGLHEDQLIAPEVGHSVGDRLVEPTPHRGRAGDGIGAGALRDPGLDPDNRLRAIARRGDPGILELRLDGLGYRDACGPFIDRTRRHEGTPPWEGVCTTARRRKGYLILITPRANRNPLPSPPGSGCPKRG